MDSCTRACLPRPVCGVVSVPIKAVCGVSPNSQSPASILLNPPATTVTTCIGSRGGGKSELELEVPMACGYDPRELDSILEISSFHPSARFSSFL
ncbi:hypothetical protein CEXT_784411 [Caerostris extrusa]|uniref:Uncharacterized protein n=1 Tax=Caerostris extrusa TaxID=172846 RepID=A0AAV4R014_CAEEX|nr:hypothetical protein CEXT_784411 [Caerostris extrusa]